MFMKSPQDIFNEVSEFAMSAYAKWGSGAQSKAKVVPGSDSPNNGCYYRHPDEERRCFVGCLIPDDKFNECMESLAVNNLFDKFPDTMDEIGLSNCYSGMLQVLQSIHDTYSPKMWREELIKYGNNNGLLLPDCLKTEGEVA